MLDITLWVVLAVAAATDLARAMVYNWLTIPAMIIGLVGGWWLYGLDGLVFSGIGFLLGGLLLLLPFLLGAMGGGDVKLMAAVGALSGPLFVLKVAIYACLAGGLAALIIMARRRRLAEGLKGAGRVFRRLFAKGERTPASGTSELPPIPFAACIAVGALFARFWDFLPLFKQG